MIHDIFCFKMHINHWYHKKKQPIAVDVFFSWYLLLVMWAQQHVGTSSSSSSSSSSFISSIVVSSISSYITSILHSIYIYIYQSQIYISISQIYIIYHQLIHLSSSTIYLLSTINSTLCLVVTLTCGRIWGQSPDCFSDITILTLESGSFWIEKKHTHRFVVAYPP